jgi:hypothetical protein
VQPRFGNSSQRADCGSAPEYATVGLSNINETPRRLAHKPHADLQASLAVLTTNYPPNRLLLFVRIRP